MSLKVRLIILLGVLTVVFLTSLQIIRKLKLDISAEQQRESLIASKLELKKWIDLTNQPLNRFVADFATWSELATFLRQPDPRWAENNLKSNLTNYSSHVLWIMDGNGRVIYSAQATPDPPLPPPALFRDWLERSGRTPKDSFFTESRDGVLEIWCRPIPAADAGEPKAGFLVIGQLWNDRRLITLGRLVESELQLAPPRQPETRINTLPLLDARGDPLRVLIMASPGSDPTGYLNHDSAVIYLFISFVLLVVVALWIVVRSWILQPLDRIGQSLAQQSAAPLSPFMNEATEMGRLAQLVATSFKQKAALEQEILERKRSEAALRESENQVRQSMDQRNRLARDLHDGVIQSIYAAGLGLESALTQMNKDPEGARSRLQHCRQSLNEIIREVRGFIGGMEQTEPPQRGFARELAVLTRTLQALWPAKINASIDESAARLLTPFQESQALQICRECISNAVRHGNARKIDIGLENNQGQGRLRIRDDGGGFDPAERRESGSGLANLEARARELRGELQLLSRRGEGCTVTILFPLTPASP
jgi:signal transduction histidine kinase